MERSVSILKFGGTSVGNGDRIRQVAAIVTRQVQQVEENFPAVVVSAMAGITDTLLRIARLTTTNEIEASTREVDLLKEKHRAAAALVARDPLALIELLETLETTFTQIAQDVELLRNVREQVSAVPLRTAAIAAWGERLSVLLVTAALRDLGLSAMAIRAEVIVIESPLNQTEFTPGTVIGAEPRTELTRINAARLVKPLLEQGIVPVMAGFIGRTEDGIVATLGRNGSDYSAAVIGAAVDCTMLEIYTDVDGILTADPRLVPNARLLHTLSYVEAAQLSWFGAKVLHPRTLIPLAARKIAVRVRNTFNPQNRGTLIEPISTRSSAATAITVRHQLALITVESRHLFGAPENVGQIFELAARAGITPVAICSSSGHHLAFMIEEKMADLVVKLLQHDLENWEVTSRKGLAACACIGSGFIATPMSPARASTALAREHIPVITQGSSDGGIIFIIKDSDSERALRALHRDLIAPVIPLVRHNYMPEKRLEVL